MAEAARLPSLPNDCICKILAMICELRVRERVGKFYAVAVSQDPYDETESRIWNNSGLSIVSKHTGIVTGGSAFIFTTYYRGEGLYADDCETKDDCCLKLTDRIDFRRCSQQAKYTLFLQDWYNFPACDEYDHFRENFSFPEDVDVVPCLAWGQQRALSYRLDLSRSVGGRWQQSVVEIPKSILVPMDTPINVLIGVTVVQKKSQCVSLSDGCNADFAGWSVVS